MIDAVWVSVAFAGGLGLGIYLVVRLLTRPHPPGDGWMRDEEGTKEMFRRMGFTVRDTPHGWEARRDD